VNHPAIAELYRSVGNVRWKGERFSRELRAIYSDNDSKNYKLIVSSKAADPDAGLFDLRADPGENHDLSAERPEVVKAMTRVLDHWSANQSALSPVPVEELDPETRRQLEALGYIDGGALPEP
jgi:hypothetical protein